MSIIANGTRVVDKEAGGYSAGVGTVVGHTPGVPYPYAIQFDGADCVFTRKRDEFTVIAAPKPLMQTIREGASGWLDEHGITHEHAEQLFRYIEAAIDYDEENN